MLVNHLALWMRRMHVIVLFLTLFGLFLQSTGTGSSLHDYLHSQLTTYDVLDPVRIISKRSLGDGTSQHLHFRALNRTFHVVLNHGYSGTSSPAWLSVQTVRDNALVPYNASHLFSDFFSGYLEGYPDSRVSGYHANNRLHLTIDDGYDVLTIEPLLLLSGNVSDTRLLAYYDADITGGQHFCAVLDANQTQHHHQPEPQLQPPPLPRPDRGSNSRGRSRLRRSADDTSPPPSQLVCRLQLVADYTFVERMGSGSVGSTVKTLIAIADDINNVYQNTRFVHPETGQVFTGVGFELASVVVLNSSTIISPADYPGSTQQQQQQHPHFNAPLIEGYQYTASHYLEAFGDFEQNRLDLRSYCINHLLTFRPMQQNILGLAYLGSPQLNYIGGVCSQDSISTYGRQRAIGRNIGMSTYANKDGNPILSRQALLVSAHELGHNMGSEHDPVEASVCSPAWSQGGPYLMYQIAVTGHADHHNHFSECSSKQIALVIKNRGDTCFQAPRPRHNICGNWRHQPPEEQCDAGPLGDDCCTPDCKLKPGAQCSDSNAACCARCRFAPRGLLCQRHSSLYPCQRDAHCDGASARCPSAPNMADDAVCQFGVGRCVAGRCDSVCSQLGSDYKPCSCENVAESCLVCCQPPVGAANRTCSPYRSPISNATINLPANQPCTVGRCFANGTCNRASGQLIVRLWDLIVQSGSNSVAIFLWKNIVLTVILLSLLLWVPACAIIAYQDRLDAGKPNEVNIYRFGGGDLVA